ncbi:MAG: C45 family autoproteolytic acyltransferase/hydrolase [Desulfobacterales bacterium]
MNIEPIPVIELNQTDPKKRGQAYGEAARDRIDKIIAAYREIFHRTTGDTWEQTVDRGAPFIIRAKAFAPDLVEEIQGIADGAGRAFEDIFLLNARSEILFNPQVLARECTAMAALPEATRNGETLLAQNWDWYNEVVNCQVILKIGPREAKPALITFTEAGQLAKIGLNAAGIGLVVNNLTSDQPRAGVPWIFLTRRVLESSSLAQALGYVLNAGRAHSINFLIGYAAGEAVNLETSPVEAHVLWPENGICVHTNHYLNPGKNFRDLKPLRDPYPSTYLRCRRAQKMAAEVKGNIDVPEIQNILKDHMDKPFSVCMHRNPAVEPLLQIATCLSIVMNLSRQQIHYTLGNPCRGEVQTIEL